MSGAMYIQFYIKDIVVISSGIILKIRTENQLLEVKNYVINRDHLSQTSADSTVRVLPLSRFCPDFPENHVRCLSAVRIFCPVSVCPDSVCLGFVSCPDSVRIFRKIAVRCLFARICFVSILFRFCPLSGF